MQKLSIIDTIGPFILETNRGTINWSKVPFSDLEKAGRLPVANQKQIVLRFEAYVKKVSTLGYNTLSIDDLAHLACMPFYSPDLKQLLQDYRQLYKKLFVVARQQGMSIYVNTDYLFFNKDIESYLAKTTIETNSLFEEILEGVFKDFPELSGIILRIGENDGKDVSGHFLSKLLLKTPAQTRALLQNILPIFEAHKKTLIFRTWTVGAYKIGDLIWNQATFDTVFASIKSTSLVISMKFGDTDFMRYLRLNPLFFHGTHKKIVELQTRREWEGMGELVSFTGWDYEKYLAALGKNDSVIGIHVWCQTGGWASWNNLTYLKNSSLWNELNTEVAIALCQGSNTEQAISLFCKNRGIKDAATFSRLLQLSEITIKKGLYISEVAKKELYVRRTRIPTLLWLEWDRAPLQPLVISLLRSLILHPGRAIREASEAAAASKKMFIIGKKLALDKRTVESLRFNRATFVLFAHIRRYIFSEMSPAQIKQLRTKINRYQKTYPQHYKMGTIKAQKVNVIPRRLLRLAVREGAGYRKRDRLLLASSPLQRWLVRYYLRRSGSHLANQSMGIETLFK